MKRFTKRISEISKRGDLPVDKQHLFDEVVAGYDGRVAGPYSVLLHSPELAKRIAMTGSYIRFETSLPQDVYELAVLTATRELHCQYAWTVHQAPASNAGVREEAILAIRDRTAPEGLRDDEALVVVYIQELLRDHKVSEPIFKAAMEKFGIEKLVDLTATVGHYGTLACILNSFEVEPDIPLLPV